jgi:AraC-like DNA-binding protein
MNAAELQSELFRRLAQPFTAEALFDRLPDVVFFIKNDRGQYVVVNQTLVERCGRSDKRELIGRRADEVFPALLGAGYRQQDEEVLSRGHAIRDQLELHFYPTGECGWCVTNKLPLRGHDGDVVGLYGVSKDLQGPNERSEHFAPVAEAVRRIRAHYDQPLQVGDLARHAGLSVYQFEQRIRRIFHISAGQLVQKTRLEAAVERLMDSDEPIAAIATACGYSDQSAFTRKFREAVGLSPSQYRRSFRGCATGASAPSLRRARTRGEAWPQPS